MHGWCCLAHGRHAGKQRCLQPLKTHTQYQVVRTDQNRYPGNNISDLYRHRWKIERGYREVKQGMLDSRWTLRSKLPELVRQEWRANNVV
ncbi:transposase [Erwinia sp. 1181_3]